MFGENPFAFAIDGGQFQVTDFTAGPDQSPVLFRITGDGKRQIISNFRDPGQGPLGAVPIAISLTAFDDVLVLDLEGNRDLFRINSTGQREVLVANIGIEPSGIAVLSVPLVLAADAGRRARGALFVLDPVSGECHMLSDFGNLRQCREDSDDVEYLGLNPSTVAVVESGAGPFAGKILVVDADAGTSRLGAVFSVDPATGHRDLLADFGNPAQCRQSPCPPAAFQPFTAFGLAVRRPTGELFVSDSGFGPFRGGLFIVESPSVWRVVSDFNNQSQGSPLPVDVLRIAAAPDGTAIWALDEDGGTGGRGALITIDRVSDRVRGLRRPESNFGRGEPRGVDPNGLAFVASGDLLVADPIDHRGGALFLVDALNGSRRVVSNFANEDQCTDPDRTKCRATMAIDVAIDPAGGVLVIDQAGGPLRPPVQVGRGTVVRVSPFDGMRTVLSDFRDLAVEELNDNSHYFCFTQRSGVVVRSSIPCLTSVAFTKKPILRSREIQ